MFVVQWLAVELRKLFLNLHKLFFSTIWQF